MDFEVKARAVLADLGFTLTAKADRIDVAADGRAYIYDYKTPTDVGRHEVSEYQVD